MQDKREEDERRKDSSIRTARASCACRALAHASTYPPPPLKAKELRVDGFCAARQRVLAASLAALGLDKAAAALWVANDAVSTAMDARHDVERERAEEKATGTTPELRKAVAALLVAAARRVNAVNEIAPTEATAAAISKVAALVEEYKLVASQFKGNKKDAPEPEPEPTPEPETPAT